MRRTGVLVGFLLAGGVWAMAATAAPGIDRVHLSPAATSVDHAPFCDVPGAPASPAASGGTAVTFTLLPPGC